MFFNITVGFLIPWLITSPIIKKQPRLFIIISPIAAIISMVINTAGFYFDFWHFKPFFMKNETISAMPLDLGLYAILGTLLIYSLEKNLFGMPKLLIFMCFSLFTTLLEYLALQFGIAGYSNGWNIGWTFFSYFIAYLAVILAWRIVRSYVEIVR